jgi:hypothetical protein
MTPRRTMVPLDKTMMHTKETTDVVFIHTHTHHHHHHHHHKNFNQVESLCTHAYRTVSNSVSLRRIHQNILQKKSLSGKRVLAHRYSTPTKNRHYKTNKKNTHTHSSPFPAQSIVLVFYGHIASSPSVFFGR